MVGACLPEHCAEAAVHWFAIFTMPRHEKVVTRHFEQREVEYFLPLHQKVSSWKNRQRVKIALPLFPRYVFARIDREKRIPVLQTPGVLQIVGAGAEPTPLPDSEIEFLRTEVGRGRVEPYTALAVGERVRISTGPMAGIEGVLVRKQNGARFVLTLALIHQSVSIEVEAEDVEPCEHHLLHYPQ